MSFLVKAPAFPKANVRPTRQAIYCIALPVCNPWEIQLKIKQYLPQGHSVSEQLDSLRLVSDDSHESVWDKSQVYGNYVFNLTSTFTQHEDIATSVGAPPVQN
ncbi:uncharacterized protein N7469_010064 [Penicillium citrinum]|uniref:Uncharacterized protein n=1 Tax=Penicillium citrinum TaxID=5077 RepID=A0A9W9TFQ8_PENCI|nr:uncharacterized protein N7469_010064 [Penicillium citrinum]KAJ5221177.1 hypothetical protein N7469_010064 [Penicillium citrinum]